MSAPRRIYLPEASNDRLDRLKAEGYNLTLGDVVARALALYEVTTSPIAYAWRGGEVWHVRDGKTLVIRLGKSPEVEVVL